MLFDIAVELFHILISNFQNCVISKQVFMIQYPMTFSTLKIHLKALSCTFKIVPERHSILEYLVTLKTIGSGNMKDNIPRYQSK